jgi:hypothetical protein
MSCVLGFATAELAIVAADTRLNISPREGEKAVHDSGPLTIKLDDGGQLAITAEYRKVRRLRNGWIGAAGVFPLMYWTFEALLRADAKDNRFIEATMRRVCSSSTTRLRRILPKQVSDIPRTYYVLVADARAGFTIRALGPDGQDVLRGSNLYLMTPPEIPPARNHTLRSQFGRSFRAPRSFSEIPVVIRLVSELLHYVYGSSETVSDFCEIGLMFRDDRGAAVNVHLFRPNAEVLRASDRTITGMLQVL